MIGWPVLLVIAWLAWRVYVLGRWRTKQRELNALRSENFARLVWALHVRGIDLSAIFPATLERGAALTEAISNLEPDTES